MESKFSYKSKLKTIENSAKELWNHLKVYDTEVDNKKSPYFYLEMFPYPSAAGLHIGHPLGYVASDIYCRFMRMLGYNVLYTIGFDSFGLPAEQFAIQTGKHPKDSTEENINNMIKQLKHLSLSYDWNKMVVTSDPSYYKWTQWIFLKMYNSFFDDSEIWKDNFGNIINGKAKDISILYKYLKDGSWHISESGEPKKGNHCENYTEEQIEKAVTKARLAYLDYVDVNWCPKLGTVLSNEEVTKDGKSERGNFPVHKTKMNQWMLRITKYADRLSSGFENIEWPEETVTMQKNWIGKSKGAHIVFKSELGDIKVYTTRPDTILGVTFIAVGEDHPKYGIKLTNSENEKIGHFTGKYAIHPITNENIPIWVCNYVIDGYGTGAVMGVPAHDERDFEFAKKYNIEIKKVLSSKEDLFCGYADVLMDGKAIPREDFIAWLEEKKIIQSTNQYKLRDWLFSRQRYWGEPFPIVYDAKTGKDYPLDESELPLLLPEQVDFKPDIDSENPTTPLSRCKEWVYVEGNIVDGKVITKNIDKSKAILFMRETNTMPNWAGSCWYYLRYLDPSNEDKIYSKEAYDYWCGNKYATVDKYLGGSEHAVLHYLYARFWHMVMFDLGILKNPEPFKKLVHQGLITADAYIDSNENYVDVNDVEVKIANNQKVAKKKSTGEILKIDPGKMGKRYKNGIPPEDICEKNGIDVFRLHLMYMAPISQTREWNYTSIVGMERFCQSVSTLVENSLTKKPDNNNSTEKQLNKLIKSVTEHYKLMEFNTAIADLISFCNEQKNNLSIDNALVFLKLLAPCAPHLSEYWYQEIKKISRDITHKDSITQESWPTYNKDLLKEDKINIPVTLNAKFKFVLNENPEISDTHLEDIIKSRLDIENKKIMIIRKDERIIINIV